MFDPNAPSSKRAIEELQNEPLRRSLLKYAFWRTDSDADAEDLLADAVECVCNPDCKPWDSARASFSRHMRLVMDHIAVAHARAGYAKFETPDSDAVSAKAVAAEPMADQVLHDGREMARLRRLGNVLVARLEGKDPLAVEVFRAAAEGIEESAAQAFRVGCEPKEVYEAWRRLRYHGARIAADDEQTEAQRMKRMREARESATKEARR